MKLKKETHETKKVRCFMDGIDWQYHLEEDIKGATLYGSRKSLVADSQHLLGNESECGIAEVEVRFVRWVVKQKSIQEIIKKHIKK